MPRFFVAPEAITDTHILITDEDAHHIARSLRMAEGDGITVADGSGYEYLCTLTRIRDTECVAKIEERRLSVSESPIRITLYMAYPKGDKLETVIQKSCELGVDRIVPFESSRCIKRPSKDKAERLSARLNRIAEEAAKQSGRARIPVVEAVSTVEGVAADIANRDLTVLCYEDERTLSLKDLLVTHGEGIGSIGVIIGSEGGFSPEEVEKFTSAGAFSVSLGRRILRCETAPDYVLSAISFFFEL